MADERTLAAKEEPWVFGSIAPAFLGVIEVVQAQAYGLAGLGYQRRELERRQGQTLGFRRARGMAGGDQVSARRKFGTQVGGDVDRGVAVYDRQARQAITEVGGVSHAESSWEQRNGQYVAVCRTYKATHLCARMGSQDRHSSHFRSEHRTRHQGFREPGGESRRLVSALSTF